VLTAALMLPPAGGAGLWSPSRALYKLVVAAAFSPSGLRAFLAPGYHAG
jgi:hypothetical protein